MPEQKQQTLQNLLARIHAQFYKNDYPNNYYKDQRMLAYALTWPAAWLRERGLQLTPQQYERIIQQRINDIITHGEPSTYNNYFPRYLLKCLQQWFTVNKQANHSIMNAIDIKKLDILKAPRLRTLVCFLLKRLIAHRGAGELAPTAAHDFSNFTNTTLSRKARLHLTEHPNA